MRKTILLLLMTITTFMYCQNPTSVRFGIGKVAVDELLFLTDSNSSTWTPSEIINDGEVLVWEVTGEVEIQPEEINLPTFDLLENSSVVNIHVYSDTEFIGLDKIKLINLGITGININSASELTVLNVSNNLINDFNIKEIHTLKWIYLNGNYLSTNLLDELLIDLNNYGLTNGRVEVRDNHGNLSSNSYQAYQGLITKGWVIDVESPPNPAPPPDDSSNPSIGNFYINNEFASRVYFDSSESITASNVNGFIIQGMKINSITINGTSLGGHYFTMDAPLTYWDNILIRYEGTEDSEFEPISNECNLVDIDGNKLNNFTLRYIKNNIEEPTSSDYRYVSLNGNNANDGKTEAKAWRTISYAAGVATSGVTVWVKAGNYGSETISMNNSGNINNPIKFIGYKNTIGDAKQLYRFPGMVLKDYNDDMPYIEKGRADYGIRLNTKQFIIFRNFLIHDYPTRGFEVGKTSYAVIDNVYVTDCYNGIWSNQAWTSTRTRITNCYTNNMRKTGINTHGQYGLIDNCFTSTTKRVGQDYYISIRGSTTADFSHSNTIINSHIERFVGDSHTGHGFSIAAGWKGGKFASTQFNLILNSKAINTTNSGIELRYSGSTKNVCRNVTTGGSDEYSKNDYGFKGLTLNETTMYNVVESCTFKNVESGVLFVETTSDDGSNQPGGLYNRIINCTFDEVKYFVRTTAPTVNQYNEWINCTVNDVRYMFVRSQSYQSEISYPPSNWLDDTNTFTNVIFNNVRGYDNNGKVKPVFINNNSWDSWVGNGNTISGNGNLTSNPKLDDYLMLTSNSSEEVNVGGKTMLPPYYDRLGASRNAPYSIGAFNMLSTNININPN